MMLVKPEVLHVGSTIDLARVSMSVLDMLPQVFPVQHQLLAGRSSSAAAATAMFIPLSLNIMSIPSIFGRVTPAHRPEVFDVRRVDQPDIRARSRRFCKRIRSFLSLSQAFRWCRAMRFSGTLHLVAHSQS